MDPIITATRSGRALRRTVSFLGAMALLGGLLSLALDPHRAGAYRDGQAANLVLGQSDFTSNSSYDNGYELYNLSFPRSIAQDPVSGKIFVADQRYNRVLRYASAEALVMGAHPEGVLGQPDFTRASTNQFSPSATTMNTPMSVAIDSAGRLWVADSLYDRVLRFDNAANLPNGAAANGVLGKADFTSTYYLETDRTLVGPFSIAVDSDGRLWVADMYSNRVMRFDDAANLPNGAQASGVLGQPDFFTGDSGTGASKMNRPFGLTIASDGRLWVADTMNNRVLRFDDAANLPNGTPASAVLGQADFSTTNAGTGADRLSGPSGLTLDSAGRLWVADAQNHRVVRFDDAASLPSGASASGVLGQPNLATGTASATSATTLKQPCGVMEDSAGHLWVADSGNNRVLRFTETPTVSLTLASARVAEDGADGLAFTFTRFGTRAGPLTISFAVAGDAAYASDYHVEGAGSFSAGAGTITIPAGQASATLTVLPSADLLEEGDETVQITLGAGGYEAGAPAGATGTLANDDVPPAFTGDPPPAGISGGTYRHTFTASGTPRPTFSLSAGTLPPGLSLDPITGVLAGTPLVPGTYAGLVVSASNGITTTSTPPFTITIAGGVPSDEPGSSIYLPFLQR